MEYIKVACYCHQILSQYHGITTVLSYKAQKKMRAMGCVAKWKPRKSSVRVPRLCLWRGFLLDRLLKMKQKAQNEKNSDLCCLSYPCCGVVRGPSKSTLNRKEGFLLEMGLLSLGSMSQGGAHCPKGGHLPPPRPPRGRPPAKGTQTDPRLRPQQCRPGCLWGQRAVPHFLPETTRKKWRQKSGKPTLTQFIYV